MRSCGGLAVQPRSRILLQNNYLVFPVAIHADASQNGSADNVNMAAFLISISCEFSQCRVKSLLTMPNPTPCRKTTGMLGPSAGLPEAGGLLPAATGPGHLIQYDRPCSVSLTESANKVSRRHTKEITLPDDQPPFCQMYVLMDKISDGNASWGLPEMHMQQHITTARPPTKFIQS